MADVDGSQARILGAQAVLYAGPVDARMLAAAEDNSRGLLHYAS